MGTAVSKRKNLRSDAISSVAAKVRAARAFGEYLSQNHPENRNGSDHLLAETFIGQESYSPVSQQQHHHHHHHHNQQQQQQHPCSPSPAENQPPAQNKRRLSLISNGKFDRSLSEEERPEPPRVYTISGESGMLGESLELEVLKGSQELRQPPDRQHEHHDHAHHHHHHHAHHHRSHAHHHSQPLQSTSSTHNISHAGWGGSRQGSRECSSCVRAPQMSSQHSFDLEHLQSHEGARQRKKLERMYSVDRVSDDVPIHSWFPKENMFNFHTASTTMQAAFRGCAERKRRKQENDSAVVIQRNFRKHLRMVGSRRVRAQTFADRREKSFSRSWSDPTPIKTDSLHDSGESADLQASCGALDEDFEDLDWEAEKELEAASCEGDDFVPPKIMLISSKVPRAEYIPTIIRRDDPSIIPILYDHEHATFEDILEEIEKKLNIYRKGCKIWKMLIFCQGGPGHLYLLKNKVATFAKVEKEEDMILFWKRLSRLMSKINPEPDLIHIMGCYVLGNANGEKLFQNLKNLMTPHTIVFESPLELSAQGKQVIETYFDFRLYRLWKTHQHSKLLDYDDIL